MTAAGKAPHLPESQEDHQLDHCELQQRVEGRKELVCAHIKEHQGIQRQCIRDVVYDGNPEVPATSLESGSNPRMWRSCRAKAHASPAGIAFTTYCFVQGPACICLVACINMERAPLLTIRAASGMKFHAKMVLMLDSVWE